VEKVTLRSCTFFSLSFCLLLVFSESLEGDVPEQVEKDFVPEINNSTGRYLVGDLMSFGHYMLKATAMG